MNIVQRTYDLIRRGQSSNRPPSIPTGFNKLDECIHGIRQGTYTLIGGQTGTGKSQFIRNTYIYTPYDYYMLANNPSVLDIEIVDFSLEMPAEENMAKAMVRKIYLDHGQVIPINRLMRWGDAPMLSEAQLSLVNSMEEYFEQFYRKVTVIDQDTTPVTFHDTLMEIALANGTFTTTTRQINNCGVWTPHNPNKVVIILVDTLNLTDSTITKNTMDTISRTAVKFKNKCRFSFVVVQQFNSDLDTTDRSRYGISTPVLKDFMDSTNPTKDCTLALGLYAPYKHYRPEKPLFRGYDILKLRDWLVSIHVMKNRHGVPNACIPMKFSGAVGVFEELLPANRMTELDYLRAVSYNGVTVNQDRDSDQIT